MAEQVFEEKKVSKAYFKLAIPLVLSMLVTLIYNLTDTYFVAQTNNTNLVAGVSLGMPIFTLLMAIGNIFGQGGSSLISRLFGLNKIDDAKKVSSFCFYITFFIGIIIACLMLIFRVPIVYLIGADSNTFNYASDYYIFLAIGAPALMLSFIHSNFLRSEGMSKESMIGTILGALVNIVLDPIFISTLNMGASGAAIASVIGYIVSDLYFLIIVMRKSRILSVLISDIVIPKDYIQQVFMIGIPAAIVNLMQSISVVLINQFLNNYGNDKIAAMGIAMKISMIALLLLTGLSFGGQPLFGYYYGANDKKRFKDLFDFVFRFISLVAIILTVVITLFSVPLMQFFINEQTIISQGSLMLCWQVISMIFVAIILLITIMFQATGKAKESFVLSISRQGIIFLIVILIGYYIFGYMGVIYAQAVADCLTAIMAIVLFYRSLYREIKI